MKQCTLEGCTKRYHALGYCQMHYGRLLRQGDPNVVLRNHHNREQLCNEESCTMTARNKGKCRKHYMREKQRNRVVEGICVGCGKSQPIEGSIRCMVCHEHQKEYNARYYRRKTQ